MAIRPYNLLSVVSVGDMRRCLSLYEELLRYESMIFNALAIPARYLSGPAELPRWGSLAYLNPLGMPKGLIDASEKPTSLLSGPRGEPSNRQGFVSHGDPPIAGYASRQAGLEPNRPYDHRSRLGPRRIDR